MFLYCAGPPIRMTYRATLLVTIIPAFHSKAIAIIYYKKQAHPCSYKWAVTSPGVLCSCCPFSSVLPLKQVLNELQHSKENQENPSLIANTIDESHIVLIGTYILSPSPISFLKLWPFEQKLSTLACKQKKLLRHQYQ